jgi:hypothetical protein
MEPLTLRWIMLSLSENSLNVGCASCQSFHRPSCRTKAPLPAYQPQLLPPAPTPPSSWHTNHVSSRSLDEDVCMRTP